MVDAGGLNPPGAKALYRFESDPGHINLGETFCFVRGTIGR